MKSKDETKQIQNKTKTKQNNKIIVQHRINNSNNESTIAIMKGEKND